MKTSKQMERNFKGVANHHRIDALLLLSKKSDLNLGEIAKELEVNFQTMAEHMRRLHHAGLVNKRYHGLEVLHALSPYGKKFLTFISAFQNL